MQRFVRHSVWAAVVILAALIEATWLGVMRFQGVLPDLILLLVVFFGITEGEERAMFTGVMGGLFQDVASNSALGHHVLCLVVVGFVAGRMSHRLVTDHPAVQAATVFAAGLIHGLLFTTIAYIQNPQIGAINLMMTSVVPKAFYTALVTPLVFLAVNGSFRIARVPHGGQA
jgi:rod shape-determining protein MreD